MYIFVRHKYWKVAKNHKSVESLTDERNMNIRGTGITTKILYLTNGNVCIVVNEGGSGMTNVINFEEAWPESLISSWVITISNTYTFKGSERNINCKTSLFKRNFNHRHVIYMRLLWTNFEVVERLKKVLQKGQITWNSFVWIHSDISIRWELQFYPLLLIWY